MRGKQRRIAYAILLAAFISIGLALLLRECTGLAVPHWVPAAALGMFSVVFLIDALVFIPLLKRLRREVRAELCGTGESRRQRTERALDSYPLRLALAIASLLACVSALLPPAIEHWRVATDTSAIYVRVSLGEDGDQVWHSPEDFAEELAGIQDEHPWQQTGIVIGRLRSAGVHLWSDALAFDELAPYRVLDDDATWQSIAQKVLGEEDLWPIILLLNLDEHETGENPPPGSLLSVPKPRD